MLTIVRREPYLHCDGNLAYPTFVTVLAAYSLGASPSLISEIFTLHQETAHVRPLSSIPLVDLSSNNYTFLQKPMLPLAPFDITEHNWTEYLGDEQ